MSQWSLTGERTRLDRFYCSSTCRVRGRKERQRAELERITWEAENPEAAAAEKAEREEALRELTAGLHALLGPNDSRRRLTELQTIAERCAECRTLFAPGAAIYRRRRSGDITSPVLPYCVDHRCAQLKGHHNRDAPPGRYYPNCRCEDDKWEDPEPCLGCRRLVSHPANAKWRRPVRDWRYLGEPSLPARPRVFCGSECKRRVFAVEAKGRRLAARAARASRTCSVCKHDFMSRRGDASYCSHACRQRAYRIRAALP